MFEITDNKYITGIDFILLIGKNEFTVPFCAKCHLQIIMPVNIPLTVNTMIIHNTEQKLGIHVVRPEYAHGQPPNL
jgi:hypothetical protein